MLAAPGYRPIQDATMPPPRSQTSSRSALFVHVHTDAGVEGLGFGSALPAVRITLPDGTVTTTGSADAAKLLSAALGREVALEELPSDGDTEGRPWNATPDAPFEIDDVRDGERGPFRPSRQRACP